ncbi:unnamed protein product [Effrenium voratum]|uniref:Uncharacterized protein n=1 Tax=Effrenium voratum TaxID=2562239 RepID=A0AA36IZC6_9DINO|nr:unnamed protein product [Effrenium voratum]CAJ1413797.1 unnamed protein product [Effrenium voratum]CAJ1444432.1 unnamed protein product [Effrenium voratum]
MQAGALQSLRLAITNLNCEAPAVPRGLLRLRISPAQILADGAASTQAMSQFQADTDHWDLPNSHLWDIAQALASQMRNWCNKRALVEQQQPTARTSRSGSVASAKCSRSSMSLDSFPRPQCVATKEAS